MPDPRDFLPPTPWDGPPLPEVFLRAFELTPERIALVQIINNEIRKRKSYGERFETITKLPCHQLIWSNASTAWYIRSPRLYPSYRLGGVPILGDQVYLDADEIIIQGALESDIRAVLRWFEPLPLYIFSTEAKLRGIFDPLGWLKAAFERWREEEGEE